VIHPCICNNQEILCRGGNNNLKKIFENLSKNLTNHQKHFDTFELFDNYTEIEDIGVNLEYVSAIGENFKKFSQLLQIKKYVKPLTFAY
jgi:hypothetical protein